MNELLAATALFVVGHLALSSVPVRTPLIALLGEYPFRGAYSAFVLAALVWAIGAYQAAPVVALWPDAPILDWVAVLLMPFALLLAIASVTTKNPTRIGADIQPSQVATTVGIIRVTRHPMMWGFILWAGSHALATGDLANLILMGGFVLLAIVGMAHIDSRRAREFGAAWGPILLSTSVVPFVAILSGRTRMDWAGIGWQRPAAALAVYAILLLGHEWIFGTSALPG